MEGQGRLDVVLDLGDVGSIDGCGVVRALAEEGARGVVVDLGGATVATSGLDTLVTASALLEELNGELVLSPLARSGRPLNSFVILVNHFGRRRGRAPAGASTVGTGDGGGHHGRS